MTVTFYLELQNGEKFTWVNHTVTKEPEIEWLLKEVRKKLEEALAMKDVKEIKELPNVRRF